MPAHRSEPQLCLQFASLSDAAANAKRLGLALDTVPFSTVILSGPAGSPLEAAPARSLVELVQSKNIAALLAGDAELARALGADGVHVPWSAGVSVLYRQVREALGTRFIVGADAGRSRHDAMEMAEAGADYIGFGIPPHVDERGVAAGRRLDLCAWWAEIFEVPVMALDVETAHDVSQLSAVQTDFIGLTLPSGLPDAEFIVAVQAMQFARSSRPAGSHAMV